MTTELVNVTGKLGIVKVVTCVTTELSDIPREFEGVTLTVLLSCVTKGVTVKVLPGVTTLLLVWDEENFTVVIRDPTVGATDEVIFTKVLLSVTLVVLRDVTVDRPWNKNTWNYKL